MIKFCPYFGKISKDMFLSSSWQHICPSKCNFIQHNKFCLKKGQNLAPYFSGMDGDFQKKNSQVSVFLILYKYLKIKKIWGYYLQILPYFAWISQKMALKSKVHRIIQYRRVKEATMFSKNMNNIMASLNILITTEHLPILLNTNKYKNM